jgi:Mce-associated membrane protein
MTERIEGTESGADGASGVEPGKASDTKADKSGQRGDRQSGTVSIRVSTVVSGAVIAALVIAVGVLAGLLWSARSDLADQKDQTAADKKAEQVATEYAVGAATVNYQDIPSWVAKLKANTVPQLANKFDATAPKLEQILVPLKWTSTATPITAKVLSDQGGIYKIDVFVNVSSTNAQSPEGAQTTVTYNVTLDKNSDWKITDVGGVDGALPVK